MPDFPPHPNDFPVFDLPDLAAATYATMGTIGADVTGEGVTGAGVGLGVGLSVTAAFTKPVVGSSVVIGLSVGDAVVGDELGTTVG